MVIIGQISAVINACVLIAHWTTGLASVIVLMYFRRNSESPTTWSRFTANIQKSLWPQLLRTQSATLKNVQKSMQALMIVALFGDLLLTVSHIVLPLGLYTSSSLVSSTTFMETQYVADTGAFGPGKSDRSYYTETRTCDMYYVNMPCPGQSWLNGVDTLVNASVPQDILDTFSSGNVSSLTCSIETTSSQQTH
jgi:hypothetical protein